MGVVSSHTWPASVECLQCCDSKQEGLFCESTMSKLYSSERSACNIIGPFSLVEFHWVVL